MLSSILIIVASAALLVYWFRYTCLLLVRAHAQSAREGSALRSFNFGDVQDRLGSETELDPLRSALEHDYQVLTYLVKHASGLALEGFEERLLVWDYKMMQTWYSLTRTAAPEQARAALREMAAVLGILAGRIGDRAGVHSEAA